MTGCLPKNGILGIDGSMLYIFCLRDTYSFCSLYVDGAGYCSDMVGLKIASDGL